MSSIEWLVLFVVVVIAITMVYYQLYTGVPPMPSSERERRLAIKLLREADLDAAGTLYELGCGWGGLLLRLAEAFPDQKVVGFELSWLPYWVARYRCRHLPQVRIYRQNFFHSPLPDAAAVICYLMMGPMPELARHFDRCFNRKTYVVTIAFWMHDRQPVQTESGVGPGVALYCWPSDERAAKPNRDAL